ncbi:MAG: ribosome biogenesis GTPase Der [Rickettsiales bacterium]|nr:ribosome biogenesis GTPase Der [Pseudomonadota bacterium]MDA0966166.1 ribosome biogenesis GTPase Der [Pseudomonadota bacterium]MDG4543169.1 ribosome biogenesis GTPase Der [Rickettsiales bacterium]MDG4545367.1 ribosome biogenesis GTPase Der [Rickettsiales bacterium]MDG4547816.1 ribosome biogenesis GTPase Der [Rickettsiales bacterium]
MSFTACIIGRPNVGKSTLFNRLSGKKHALVDDRPGVTRDRREGAARIGDMEFRVIDTAGLEEAEEDALETRMLKQTRQAVEDSDLCLMVIDGRAGLTPDDKFFANWLRKIHKSIILIVNKCEGSQGEFGLNESYGLGFRDIVPISAEHNEGMADLYEAIAPYKAQYDYEIGELEITKEAEDGDKFIQVAIVGRPNTGKSTYLNSLYGENRVLTGPEAGITRDSISIDWQFEGKNIRLIDTAGIRRKSNVQKKLEKLSVADSLRALRYAHVAILMIDATMPFEKQDLHIAETIANEGRAVVIALNKWDLVEDKAATLKELKYKADELLPQIKGVSLITISALNGENVEKVMKSALEAYNVWNKRITTSKLNDWLREAESKHLPPLAKNKKRIRLKYMTQGNTRPPTFTVFINRPEDLPASYKRYIENSLRDDFSMPGVPLRVMFRKNENPYEKKK